MGSPIYCKFCAHRRIAHGLNGCFRHNCRCRIPHEKVSHIGSENFEHYQAKWKLRWILEDWGYNVEFEKPLPYLIHKGRPTIFPVDVYAYHKETGHKVIIQVDGQQHDSSSIQIGKTANRDDTILKQYCKPRGIQYIVIPKGITELYLETLEKCIDRQQ